MEAPPLDDFVPAQPGTWTFADREASTHEALHAVAAVLLDVEVREVRIDRPDLGVLGHCAMVTHVDRWRHAVVAVAPLVLTASPPAFDRSSDDGDLAHASEHWLAAGENRSTWPVLLDLARSLLTTPAGKRAVGAVAREVLAQGALPGYRVKALVDAGKGP